MAMTNVLSSVRNLVPPISPLWRLAFWAAAALVALRGQLLLEDRSRLGVAAVCMIAATLLIAAATWGQRLADVGEPGAAIKRVAFRVRLRPAAAPLAIVVVALALGVAFRFYRLAATPAATWFDEAQNGVVADRILHDAHYWPVFITGYVGTNRPALPVYVFALGIEFLGREVLALRSISAGAGILTLVALFFLARELFGLRAAALATFLLAVMRWHITFSRLGMEPIWGPFFAASAVFFFVRGSRRRRWYDFATCGVLVGLGLYFYWAFVLVPALLAIYAVHALVTRRSLPAKSLALAIGLVAVIAFVVYSPIAVYGVQHPAQYKQRADQVSITKGKSIEETWQAVLRNARRHALMFNSKGDHNARHNLADAPMLDTFTGVLFVLGIGMSLARLRQSSHFLLLAWLVVLLQPAIWSAEFEAPQALRSILVTPAVAMLAALPLASLWDAGWQHKRSGFASPPGSWRVDWTATSYLVRGVVALTLLFFLVQIAYGNYHTYFDEQQRSDLWLADSDVTFVAKEMNRLGPSYRYVLSDHFANRPTLSFINPQANREAEYNVDLVNDVPLIGSRPTAIFLDGARRPEFYWLRELYPNASVREAGPAGADQVLEVVVSSQEIDALHGVEATYTSHDGAVLHRRERAVDFDRTSLQPVPVPFDARWSGLLRFADGGMHTFEVVAPGGALLRIDGEVLASGAGELAATSSLLPGYHRFELEATVTEPGRVSFHDNGKPLTDDVYFSTLSGNQGLQASFFDNGDWSGEPKLQRIDPLVGFFYPSDIPFFGISSAMWTGTLLVPTAGSYSLEIEATGDAAVALDGAELLSTSGRTGQRLNLAAGSHEISVRFRYTGEAPRVLLYWIPPGQDRRLIPTWVFAPR